MYRLAYVFLHIPKNVAYSQKCITKPLYYAKIVLPHLNASIWDLPIEMKPKFKKYIRDKDEPKMRNPGRNFIESKVTLSNKILSHSQT